MIYVADLAEGVVIDHIQAGAGYKIFSTLHLDTLDSVVLLMRNFPSEKMGKKDLIKIETDFPLDLEVLGLIDPDVTVNIVKDGKISKKFRVALPQSVEGILSCKNPRCITHIEHIERVCFHLYDAAKRTYTCEYCDTVTWL